MISQNNQYKPSVVDLFSGAGGTGYGFSTAGFHILGAIEKDDYAADTYEHNLKVNVTRESIQDIEPQEYRERLGLQPGELDVLVGCPPCQGFTRMRNSDGASDSRNDLVITYLDYVREFKPRFALFENVPGIIRTDHGKKYFDRLCAGLSVLEGFGGQEYGVSVHEVDAANYGTPQHRVRVIVIASRDGTEFPFPLVTHGDPASEEVKMGQLRRWVTVRDAISDYPKIAAGENGENNDLFPNHIAPATGERVLSFIRMVPEDGGSRTEVNEEHWLECHIQHNGHKDVYGRVAWDKPCNVITSGCTNPSKGRFVHPEQDRALTAREAARLQGFPDTFRFQGKNISKQIGNAVPPPLARAIAEAILEQLCSADVSEEWEELAPMAGD